MCESDSRDRGGERSTDARLVSPAERAGLDLVYLDFSQLIRWLVPGVTLFRALDWRQKHAAALLDAHKRTVRWAFQSPLWNP